MKKIIILSLCIFTLTFAKSQETDAEFKQSSGDNNLELQFNPGAIFAANTGNIFSNGLGIRFRKFNTETFAYRLTASLNMTSLSTITQDEDNDLNLDELKTKNSNLGVFIQPGFENHFAGTKRLSPYWGAEAVIGYQSSTTKAESQAAPDADVETLTTKNGTVADGFTVGIAAIAGADFYISKKLYLGAELNYGLYYFSAFTTKISDTTPNTDDIETKIGNTSGFTFGPGVMGIFRIGFLF